jgi:transcriptional regulator NrdR family protein
MTVLSAKESRRTCIACHCKFKTSIFESTIENIEKTIKNIGISNDFLKRKLITQKIKTRIDKL